MGLKKKKKQQKSDKNKHKSKMQKVQSFVEKRVTSLVGKKLKGKSLDELAAITCKMIEKVGSNEMRGKVIKSAEDDIKAAIKKGMTDDEILAPALASPNYKRMLEMVGMNYDHLRIILKEQRSKKWN